MLRSISLRLAALYTALFALAVAVLGAMILFATREALARQFEARITTESVALAQEFRTEGLNGVLQAVRERDRTPGALDYGFKGPGGVPLAGRLSTARASSGWSVVSLPSRSGRSSAVRLFSTDLGGGYRLLVGDDLEQIEALDGVVLRGFAVALLGVILLGAAGGYALSRDMQQRFAAMSGVAEAIIDGDLARRVPLRGEMDDLDRLAATFNRMLDRIGQLMESLRQVSNDIAHDLRTPLTRLRQRLEAALRTADAEQRAEAVEAALVDLDAILETFAGLLRISEIERGARRAAFRPLDLAATAGLVVEGFAPSAEEGGRFLSLVADGPVPVEGDAELLAQLVVNLVENGLRHTPVGSAVRVVVRRDEEGPVLSVIDDGPGVVMAEQERLFDRFYRLERSRSTPGSGLGLALVAAIAKLHGARAGLFDAGPGLEARISFPPHG
ncbi:MAG TPA: ATP-binding protein [Caulobacteraceae bacterium]|jgi:signal transduction histidine kinase|nr:ATP-binding protein [Caulobacteraceae bacterium]